TRNVAGLVQAPATVWSWARARQAKVWFSARGTSTVHVVSVTPSGTAAADATTWPETSVTSKSYASVSPSGSVVFRRLRVGVAVRTVRPSTGSSSSGTPGGSLARLTRKRLPANALVVWPAAAAARQ